MGPGETRVAGHRRGWYIVGLVLAVAVGLLFAFAGLGGVIGAAESAGVRARSGGTFGGDLALAVVSSLIVLVCVVVAMHFEHQLRRHHVAAQSGDGSSAVTMPASLWPRLRFGNRPRYSPGVIAFQILVFFGLFVGMIVGAVVTHSDADRSASVQHHGMPAVATVTGVKNTYHSSRGGGYYTAEVRMSLSPAVAGRSETVVHYPGRVEAATGSQYRILMDPRDPGYAEFPGTPATKSSSWVVLIVFAVLFGALDLLFARTWLRLRRHRRSLGT